MRKYIVLDIITYNMRKPKEFDKFKLKDFQMDDKLKVGQNIELVFQKDKLKVKLNSIVKIDDVNKKFLIDTNKFQMVAQLKQYFNDKEQMND